MTKAEGSLLAEHLRTFWSRSFFEDVRSLNHDLGKGGEGGAGLVSVPPSVLTGDPFSLLKGDCLLVLGINPKWQTGNSPAQVREIDFCCEAWNENNFERYRAERATYFRLDSKIYYGRYFTRLGNSLAYAFHGLAPPKRKAAESAKGYLARHVAKFDLLPWWSTDIAHIHGDRISPRLEPIRAWREVIGAVLADLRPKAIVINGCGWRVAIEGILGCELRHFSFDFPSGETKSAYYAMVDGTPLLAHPQLGSRGAGGHEDYLTMVRAWRKLMSDTTRFT